MIIAYFSITESGTSQDLNENSKIKIPTEVPLRNDVPTLLLFNNNAVKIMRIPTQISTAPVLPGCN